MLEARFIGKFDISFNGEKIVLTTRASQSLFAYLILTAGTRHRREKLAGLLWPDLSEKKARTYLRQELWRIRKTFSACTDREFLLSDDIAIWFDADTEYWLDVDQLAKLIEQASAGDIMQALQLYEGELLPGFYEDWITQERERLLALFEKGNARLLGILEAGRRWQETVDWAEFWLSFSPNQETAYQYLILAHQALGDHARAMAAYERCIKALRELDLEPSDLTRARALKRNAHLHIPIPLSSFIGRQKELKEVADLLKASRLVTLTGAGGIGKTRLSIQVVADLMEVYPDGIWFLDLAPLADGAFLPNTLASLLGLQEKGDAPGSITGLLISYFRTRTALLIFDNCEHLIESCAQLVHTLLTSCGQLSILATSREVLRVAGEIPYRVPSLEIPRVAEGCDVNALGTNESICLFAERAASESPGFKLMGSNTLLIGQICRRLDGIPLAIELAAARVNVLSVEQILKRLDDRFSLLAGGLRSAMPRHQTLRATIDWSYDLLSIKEQILFRRLAVFSRSWTLEMAEVICSGEGIRSSEILDLMSQLVNKSLLTARKVAEKPARQGLIRYRRLEIIREFAWEKLTEAGEIDWLSERHLKYFLQSTEEIEPHLMQLDQSDWMDALADDLGDIRLALDWAISRQKQEEALRLFSALGWFWFIRCRFREGEEWFRRMQPFLENVTKRIQAKAIRSASWLFYARDDFVSTLNMHRQCLEIYRELGDEGEMSTSLQFMGVMAYTLDDFAQARSLFEQSLAVSRRVGNRLAMPRALMHLGHLASREGDAAAVERYYTESLMVARQAGEGHLLMVILGNMGDYRFSQGNYSLAREYYREQLEIGVRLKNKRTIAQTLLNLATMLNVEEYYSESAQLQGYAENLFSESEALTETHLGSIRKTAEISKRHLGANLYASEFEHGRTLQLQQATDIALKPFILLGIIWCANWLAALPGCLPGS